MGLAEVSPIHLILLPIIWISVGLYFYLILKILRARRTNSSLFKTPFFSIVLGEAFWDLSMFFVAFFLVFCRRYLLIPFQESQGLFPQILYFLQTIFTNCMYLNSVLLASSRFSAFQWPTKHAKFWSTRNIILSNCLIATIACINVGRLFIGNPSVSLVIIAPGRMKMFQDENLLVRDGWQDLILSIGCCIICAILYILSALKSLKMGLKELKYQKKFLRCAITVFLPYIPNAIKSFLLIYAGYTKNDEITYWCIESWLFVTYLMCLIQPWVLLATYPRIRPRCNQGEEIDASASIASKTRDTRRSRVVHTEQTVTATPIMLT